MKEHLFRHNLKETVTAVCDCGVDIETTEHFHLHCQFLATEIQILLDSVQNLNISIKDYQNKSLVQVLLHGSDKYDDDINRTILIETISFLKLSKRFERTLLNI